MMKTFLLLPIFFLVLLTSIGVYSREIPSCLKETEEYCLGEDADMSAEGIETCLLAHEPELSQSCRDFFKLSESCRQELSKDGVCGRDAEEGDGVVCLLSRADKTKLSKECKDSFPKLEEPTGLRETFWKNGKRQLEEGEVASLSDEDKETYERWLERKTRKDPRKDDREYALKFKKIAKAKEMLLYEATQKIKKLVSDKADELKIKETALEAILAKYEKLRDKDESLSIKKKELKKLSEDAIQQAKKELELSAKEDL